MEPAKIDWKTVDSVFTIDHAFENINASQWVDFLAPHSPQNDDVSWFCRPDCNHPRTHEDFVKPSPASKLLRSVSVSKLIADWTRREPMNLKRRGRVNEEDSENQNPNYSTPPKPNNNNHDYKGVIKSSAEKGDDYYEINLERSGEQPRLLKGTQSAKDLFGGRDIFGKITEFCNELKKLAVISKADEREEDEEERFETPKAEINTKQQPFKVLGPKEVNERDKERKPLLEVKVDAIEKSNGKGKLRRNKMRVDDAEDIPVSLHLNKVKREDKILPIRTNPPTPQGFSVTRNPVKLTPTKGPKSRFKETDIFQELQQNKTLREELGEKSDNENASLIATKEGRALDVFWFLKPCTV